MLVQQFLRFAMFGAIGFLVDAGMLTFALAVLGLNLYTGRVLSYFAAATTTWALNRTFAFLSRSRSHWSEWLRFVVFNAFGGILNFTTYASLVHGFEFIRQRPVLGVACGSLAGLLVNFSLTKLFVFRSPRVVE